MVPLGGLPAAIGCALGLAAAGRVKGFRQAAFAAPGTRSGSPGRGGARSSASGAMQPTPPKSLLPLRLAHSLATAHPLWLHRLRRCVSLLGQRHSLAQMAAPRCRSARLAPANPQLMAPPRGLAGREVKAGRWDRATTHSTQAPVAAIFPAQSEQPGGRFEGSSALLGRGKPQPGGLRARPKKTARRCQPSSGQTFRGLISRCAALLRLWWRRSRPLPPARSHSDSAAFTCNAKIKASKPAFTTASLLLSRRSGFGLSNFCGVNAPVVRAIGLRFCDISEAMSAAFLIFKEIVTTFFWILVFIFVHLCLS